MGHNKQKPNYIHKLTKKKLRWRFVLLVLLVLVPYIITSMVPKYLGIIIFPGSYYSTVHHRDRGCYRLDVQEGKRYQFTIQLNTPENLDFTTYLYSYSFKMVGIRGNSIEFIAEHSGDYYVTVKNSKGGYFILYLEESGTSPSMSPSSLERYVDPWKLVIIVVPILAFVMGVILVIRKGIQLKEYEKQKNLLYCPMCGISSPKGTEYCKYCGYTFEMPSTAPYEKLQIEDEKKST